MSSNTIKNFYFVVHERISNLNIFMEAIKGNFPSKEVFSNTVIIFTNDSASKIYEKLDKAFTAGGGGGGFIISNVDENFAGRLPEAIWDWMNEKVPGSITTF